MTVTFPTRSLAVLAAIALLGVSAPVLAEQLTLSATLSGAEEVPPNDSAATGMLEATYDTDTNALSFTVTYDGLTGPATAAHFHGPAAPGENADPVVPIDGALDSPIAGSATLTDAQEAELLGGQWYFNVHTAAHPGGEIRGQVMQANMSSEMSTMSEESSMMLSEMSSEMSSESSSMDPSVSVSASGEVSTSVDPSVSISTSVDVSASVSVSVSP